MESEGKKINFRRTNKHGKFIVSYTIQILMVVYDAKFEASALHSSLEIFDKKITLAYMEGKKERNNE